MWDGDCEATVDPAVDERAAGWRVGLVGVRTGRWPRPLGPGGPGARARQSLVPRRSMGPGLGQRLQLGLESLPRLARSGKPRWPGGLGALGTPAGVGAAAATPTVVGTRGSADVEPDSQRLGFLEQRNMDAGLVGPLDPRPASPGGLCVEVERHSTPTEVRCDRNEHQMAEHVRRTAQERESVALERERIAEEREGIAAEREHLAHEREQQSHAREQLALRRERLTEGVERWARNLEMRSRLADRREAVADQREAIADQREALADERERVADERELAADSRESQLDDLLDGGESHTANHGLRAEQQVQRREAAALREQAEVERERATSEREEAKQEGEADVRQAIGERKSRGH